MKKEDFTDENIAKYQLKKLKNQMSISFEFDRRIQNNNELKKDIMAYNSKNNDQTSWQDVLCENQNR